MRLEDLIEIINSLNNGTVICGQDNDDTEILLSESNIKLYCANKKYYFLAEYQEDYDIIERKIRNNQFVAEIKERRPNNSYLVLLYKVQCFDNEISKKVITLEENEYFYKRYVFYYTQEEYDSFINWFNQRKDKSLTDILKTEECTPDTEKLHIQFLLRLVIKIPFLNLQFKKMEIDNFEDLMDAQLKGIRKNKDTVVDFFNKLTETLEEHTVEEIAENLFNEIVGGANSENQIH